MVILVTYFFHTILFDKLERKEEIFYRSPAKDLLKLFIFQFFCSITTMES